MKILCFTLSIIILLTVVSCDDRPDFLKEVNNPPSVYFNGDVNKTEMTDSLKTSLKIGSDTYTVNVSVVDREGALGGLGIESSVDGAEFFVSDTPINPGSVPLEGISAAIQIKPGKNGLHQFTLVASDRIGGVGQATLHLFTFDNLEPVVNCKFTKIGINSPYEYEFDATASYDQDRNLGGAVQAYKFVINDDFEIFTPTGKIRHIFSGPGGFSVKYSVVDNEGKSSAVKTELITLN
ncbi:MAG: hypothetical protein ABJH04_07340 [Cyclobacteriaceae bacterium]